MRWMITAGHAGVTAAGQLAATTLPEAVMVLRLAIAASLAILGVPASVGAQTDTLWTRGTSMTEPAIVGAVLGLVLGVQVPPRPTGEDIAKGVLVDASAGVDTVSRGVTGALVGTRIPPWKRRYP
jgi:hypothetical protein